MLSVKAIYDGEKLKFSEKIEIHTPHEVIITFLDEQISELSPKNMHEIAKNGGAFDFLINDEEDIYTDSDLKNHF